MSSPLETALAFTKAWIGHDVDGAAEYVAEDVVFSGPLQQSTGKEPYVKGLRGLAEEVTGLTVLAAFGDGHQALLMYELETKSWGTLTCAKRLTFRDGKIATDTLAFDSFPIRGGK